MHRSFEKAAEHPDCVDDVIKDLFPAPPDCKNPKFSEVFHNLFPNTKKINNNMKSFLAIFEHFNFDPDSEDGKKLRCWKLVAPIDNMYKDPDCNERKAVKQIYEKLGIDTADDRFLRFWMYLIKIYQEIRLKCTETNFHNIFAFMNEFPIDDTRVLIIAQDPSPFCESSGFAIHGSECKTTRKFLDLFNAELELMDIFCGDGEPMALIPQELVNKKVEKIGVMGWIKQGVLMMNTMLTLNEKVVDRETRDIESYWLILTHFLVEHISDTYENIAFVLIGGTAGGMRHLILQEKHLIVDVYHPTHSNQIDNRIRWDVQLPFLNVNFFLYQVSRGKDNKKAMIDWTQMLSYDENKNTSSSKLTSFFEKLLRIPNNEPGLLPLHAGNLIKSNIETIFALKKMNGYYVVNQIDPDKNKGSLDELKTIANDKRKQSSKVDSSETQSTAQETSTQDKSQQNVDSMEAAGVHDLEKLSLN